MSAEIEAEKRLLDQIENSDDLEQLERVRKLLSEKEKIYDDSASDVELYSKIRRSLEIAERRNQKRKPEWED